VLHFLNKRQTFVFISEIIYRKFGKIVFRSMYMKLYNILIKLMVKFDTEI